MHAAAGDHRHAEVGDGQRGDTGQHGEDGQTVETEARVEEAGPGLVEVTAERPFALPPPLRTSSVLESTFKTQWGTNFPERF